MSNQPCPTALLCDCIVTPFRNFSSEKADNPDFFAFAFYEGDPPLNNPPIDFTNPIGIGGCFSVVSQQDANDCALRVAEQAVWDPWRTPQGGHVAVFGNQETSCAFPCPDGAPDFIFTIAAGTVIALSQAEADEFAASLCFARGKLVIDCTNPVIRSIEVLDIDDPLDLADNAKVVVGGNAGDTLAAIYKDGFVINFSTPGDSNAYFDAVSPNGQYATGDDVSGAFVDRISTYDGSNYRVLAVFPSTHGQNVNDSGTVLISNGILVKFDTGATVFDPHLNFNNIADQLITATRTGFNNSNQAWFEVPARAVPPPPTIGGSYIWKPSVAQLVNPALNYGGRWTGFTGMGAINESGHAIVPFIPAVGVSPHAFFFNGTTSVDIGNFGDAVFPFEINDNDVAVGRAVVAGVAKAFQYSPSGGISLLPEFSGITPGATGSATDVNNGGFIVGVMDNKAFLYSPKTGLTTKLTDHLPVGSGWTTLDQALFINNLNQIVGSGTHLGNPNIFFIMQLGDEDVK